MREEEVALNRANNFSFFLFYEAETLSASGWKKFRRPREEREIYNRAG